MIRSLCGQLLRRDGGAFLRHNGMGLRTTTAPFVRANENAGIGVPKAGEEGHSISDDDGQNDQMSTPFQPVIVKSQLKNFRASPRKLNVIARQIRGLSVPDAIDQLKVHKRKKYAEITFETIRRAVNLADIHHEVKPPNLKISQAIVGRGYYLKRISYHSKGRSGIKKKPHAHLTIMLEEYDPKVIEAKEAERQKRKESRSRQYQKRLEMIHAEHKQYAGQTTKGITGGNPVILNLPNNSLSFWQAGKINLRDFVVRKDPNAPKFVPKKKQQAAS